MNSSHVSLSTSSAYRDEACRKIRFSRYGCIEEECNDKKSSCECERTQMGHPYHYNRRGRPSGRPHFDSVEKFLRLFHPLHAARHCGRFLIFRLVGYRRVRREENSRR